MNSLPRARHVGAVVLAAMCCVAAMEAQAPNGSVRRSDPAVTPSGWRPLFNGKDLTGWRGYKSEAVPAGWKAVDGVLTKPKPTGDIVTTEQYGDFELAFEWKLSRGGNAGVFYRGTEEYDHIYWSAPEYQLLDDAHHADGRNRLTSAGAAYAVYPSPPGVVKPAGQWNSSRIVVRGAHVQHWLNDRKVVDYELGSPDWQARIRASKFADYPGYGRAKRGYIGIQGDHDGVLSLRNLRIRELSR